MALLIQVKTIPHSQQRYETVGDWFWGSDASWQIRVSDLGDWRMEMAVVVHELVECAICRYKGISQGQVDEFDMAYEAMRPPGDTSEPGDDPRAPYHLAHAIATGVEHIVVAMLGLGWKEYDDTINAL